mmetsp:Transcript_9416/g.34552  ORF Transcript_9416/g.34552 Transcript_9416/m.34552 type:complete len:249 (-) Transcript_9416:310-1056(-)
MALSKHTVTPFKGAFMLSRASYASLPALFFRSGATVLRSSSRVVSRAGGSSSSIFGRDSPEKWTPTTVPDAPPDTWNSCSPAIPSLAPRTLMVVLPPALVLPGISSSGPVTRRTANWNPDTGRVLCMNTGRITRWGRRSSTFISPKLRRIGTLSGSSIAWSSSCSSNISPFSSSAHLGISTLSADCPSTPANTGGNSVEIQTLSLPIIVLNSFDIVTVIKRRERVLIGIVAPIIEKPTIVPVAGAVEA